MNDAAWRRGLALLARHNLLFELQVFADQMRHGAALARNYIGAVLSEGTECTLNGFYLVSGTQHVDHHTVIDHAKPHGTSHELYKGILDGKQLDKFHSVLNTVDTNKDGKISQSEFMTACQKGELKNIQL